MKALIQKLMMGEHLTTDEARAAMETMMDGGATASQVAAFLTALRMKGETVEEISAFARVLRDKASRVHTPGAAIDIVGTGGDGANTFNISTATAFVTAAAGMPVAKHGNRAASSLCGTADVLEALGVNITLSPARAAACLAQTGICFLFAQAYHSSMRHVAQTRREMGVRTVFNLVGPLSNPAFVGYQLLGVPTDELVQPMAEVLANLGLTHALVVHGEDGPDEVTLGGSTLVAEVRDATVTLYRVSPEDFGFARQPLAAIRGGDAQENAAILRNVLAGLPGPHLDVVLLNAGAALYVADRAGSIEAGIALAREAVASGRAMRVLDDYIRASRIGEVAS
jgi:anthranilate phosphoribosyltransferase